MTIEAHEDWQPPAYVPTEEDLVVAGEVSAPVSNDSSESVSYYGLGENVVGPVAEDGTLYGQKIDYPEESFAESVQNNLSSAAKWLGESLFGTKTDRDGRNTQSFASSIVLGAAQSILQSMNADKTIKAQVELESQRSSNRIKEATEAETRTRAAASAMPTLAKGGRKVTRQTGLLS